MTSDNLKSGLQDLAASARDAGDRGAAATREATDQARDAARTASDTAKDKLDRAQGAVGQAYERARTGAQDAAEQLSGSASDALESGQRAYRRTSDQLAHRVEKQPVEALLLAGAIGYLVGWAVSRS